MKKYKKIFLIAGVPRSGTSMIAGLLSKHGVWTGKCIAEDVFNPLGYFENKQIVRIVKDLFIENGFKARSDSKILTKAKVKKYFPDLRSKITEVVGNTPVWLYKDSKLLLISDFMMEAFPEATWILPYRNTECIFSSVKKKWSRRPRVTEQSINEMIIRLRRLQDNIAERVEHMWVNSDFIISNEGYAETFINSCGFEFNSEEYKQFIKPKIYHV